jgi:hypothetical protein
MTDLTFTIQGQKFQLNYDGEKWTAQTEYNWIEYRNDNVSFVPLKIAKAENISALFKRPAEFVQVGDKLMITWSDDLIGNIVIHLEKVPTSIDEDVQIQFKRQLAEITKLRDELKQATEEIERLKNPEVHSLIIHRTGDGIRVQISTPELRIALLKYFGQIVPELIRKVATAENKSQHPWVEIALEKKYKKYNCLDNVEKLIRMWSDDGKDGLFDIFNQTQHDGKKYLISIYNNNNGSVKPTSHGCGYSNTLADFQVTHSFEYGKFYMFKFDLQKQYLYRVDKLADYKLPSAYKYDTYTCYGGLGATPIQKIAFVDSAGKHIKLELL